MYSRNKDAQNQAEPENLAEPVPGPDQKNFILFCQKIKYTSMPNHHMKGQPAASTYVRPRGFLKHAVIMRHPVKPNF